MMIPNFAFDSTFNSAGLIGLTFWSGVAWNRLSTNSREIKELKQADQAVTVAELKVTLEAVRKELEKLSGTMEEFRNSIFLRAIRQSQDT